MRKILTTMALIALAGCATSPTPVSRAENVPLDEIYGFQDKSPENSERITVIRDTGFTGSGCDVLVYIDGKRAAKIGPGQKASFFVQPGIVNLGSGPSGSGLCAGSAIKAISANIQARQEHLFRINGDMQGFYLAPYIDYEGR
ncbi:hypothetical protein [Pseudomonas sp.]|uniref:hypothetical protein n=1 Tax=Pseudomonas sp. TaxID=306 RepID=UPI003267D118